MTDSYKINYFSALVYIEVAYSNEKIKSKVDYQLLFKHEEDFK